MTKAPGDRPGPSPWNPAGYARADRALIIAATGFAAALALLFGWSWARGSLVGVSPAVLTIIAAILTSAPLLIAVFAAGSSAGDGGVARATGIRPWRWMDALVGLAVGLGMRSVIELMHPTVGSLGGPLGTVDATTIAVVVVTAVIVSPLVEELFFRGLVLRALAQATAAAGTVLAAVVSILLSTALFVALHTVTLGAAVPVALVVSASIVGVVCGILTLATGRLGAALVAHAVSNLAGVVLLLI